MIERDIPDVGKNSAEQLSAAAGKSNAALAEVGEGIQWVQSYVTDNKLFCVYLADGEEKILEHARRSGFPARNEVRDVLDPSSADRRN
ncbi:MAG: DUF4242 domain-containing protein [Acidobacteriota bacterium]